MKLIDRIYSKLFDTFYYYELDMADFTPQDYSIDPNFQFRRASGSKEDIELIRSYSEYRKKGFFGKNMDYLKIAVERFNKPEEFHCLMLIDKEKGDIAYLRWIQYSSSYSKMMRCRVKINENEAYLIDSFTVPGYRSRGLHKFMMNKAVEHCRSIGIKKVYGAIISNNHYAIKVIVQLGFRCKKRIIRFKHYVFVNKIRSITGKK